MMGIKSSRDGQTLDEIGQSFERQWVLTEQEMLGALIGESTISNRFVRLPYSFVAKSYHHRRLIMKHSSKLLPVYGMVRMKW